MGFDTTLLQAVIVRCEVCESFTTGEVWEFWYENDFIFTLKFTHVMLKWAQINLFKRKYYVRVTFTDINECKQTIPLMGRMDLRPAPCWT